MCSYLKNFRKCLSFVGYLMSPKFHKVQRQPTLCPFPLPNDNHPDIYRTIMSHGYSEITFSVKNVLIYFVYL